MALLCASRAALTIRLPFASRFSRQGLGIRLRPRKRQNNSRHRVQNLQRLSSSCGVEGPLRSQKSVLQSSCCAQSMSGYIDRRNRGLRLRVCFASRSRHSAHQDDTRNYLLAASSRSSRAFNSAFNPSGRWLPKVAKCSLINGISVNQPSISTASS